ncbi:hypothetical protein F4808DRAFT_331101 [Astrocystis sublimbata]|nr:hypothetical protein F4808DRAFT_331101 [Astrocystis sublimbata]
MTSSNGEIRQLERTLSTMLNKNLQQICAYNDLRTSGVKAELQNRIKDCKSSIPYLLPPSTIHQTTLSPRHTTHPSVQVQHQFLPRYLCPSLSLFYPPSNFSDPLTCITYELKCLPQQLQSVRPWSVRPSIRADARLILAPRFLFQSASGRLPPGTYDLLSTSSRLGSQGIALISCSHFNISAQLSY